MKPQASFTLDPSTVAARLGMCAAAVAGIAGIATDANAVVVTSTTSIPVPNNTDGVYINFLTGAATTPASNPGWDFNPYNASGTAITFFWPGTPANSSGGVASVGSPSTYVDLAVGATISSASTFTAAAGGAGTAPTVAFQTAGNHILGVRFFNETTSAINYGYVRLTTGGAGGFPAVVTGWSYENSGAPITVMAAVPEASTTAMMALGALALGAANLRRMRRQQRQRVS
jgi:hypothetical protein